MVRGSLPQRFSFTRAQQQRNDHLNALVPADYQHVGVDIAIVSHELVL